MSELSEVFVFTQQFNPISGKDEWNPQKEDYDYKQEVARSAFADMLHDHERNEKYFEGLKISVQILRSQGKEVHVLDIGTGTGLLSMMALSLKVDSVTACETFIPMAQCAEKILKVNGYEDMLKLIRKRSTEMEVGENKDMTRRANLLITEVFDTELVGEGAIETFRHAKQHLLTEDALVVPCKGTIYAQVISSPLIRRWNKISPNVHKNPKSLLEVPANILNCPGSSALHDIQMSEIPSDSFEPLSNPIEIFKWDWTGREIPLVNDRTSAEKFVALSSGDCDAVFFWWDIHMDPLDKVLLSCAPVWHHPLTKGNSGSDSSMIPWRDHWMQAVYFPPQNLHVNQGDSVSLVSNHDEYSFWFNLNTQDQTTKSPFCDCGLHMSSRTRIGQLSDPRRTDFYFNLLEENVSSDSVVLMLGRLAFLGIVAANLGAKHVYIHEPDSTSRRVLENLIKSNKVETRITILTSNLSDVTLSQTAFCPATLVFSEPYFGTSMLPWHCLQFLYLLDEGRHLLAPDVRVLPSSMSVKALPVQFRDLWKIRAPLGNCCGFDLSTFDHLVDAASDETDDIVEPQPLWEYPSKALGEPQTLLSITLDDGIPTEVQTQISQLPVDAEGTLNGMAIWADWHFGDRVLTTGPVENTALNENIQWDMYTRQGIYLFKQHLSCGCDSKTSVEADLSFRPAVGSIEFNFNIKR